MVVFGQSGSIRQNFLFLDKSDSNPAKVNVFRHNLLYSGKAVALGHKWLCSGKWLYSGKSGCIRVKLLYSVKSGCIR